MVDKKVIMYYNEVRINAIYKQIVDYHSTEVCKIITLKLWYICRSVTRSYYRNSVGGLLVFDLGNRKSFENVKQWHAEVCERVQPHTVLFVLVGHKSDRVKAGERAVERTEAEKLAGQLGAPYIEASAKTGHNVKEAFELLTRRVYQGIKSGEIQLCDGWDGVKSSAPKAQTLQKIQNNEATEKNKNCAC